jgi:hypothetical protein
MRFAVTVADKSQTIDAACRALGVTEPGRIGDMLPPNSLKEVLRSAPKGLHFWITDVFGIVTKCVEPAFCHHFWKHEVKIRLMEDGGFMREMWPERYAYIAYRWRSPFPEPLVELMRCD